MNLYNKFKEFGNIFNDNKKTTNELFNLLPKNLKRINIQKCIQWCEKNQLPHNKFTDNVNIFLNSKRRIMDECKLDS